MIQCSHFKNKCFLKRYRRNDMNAVILGYGVVGKGIEILTNSLEDINIKYVYVRKEKENLPYFSNNEDMVVQDDIDIVFECLNGLEPANTLIQKL